MEYGTIYRAPNRMIAGYVSSLDYSRSLLVLVKLLKRLTAASRLAVCWFAAPVEEEDRCQWNATDDGNCQEDSNCAGEHRRIAPS